MVSEGTTQIRILVVNPFAESTSGNDEVLSRIIPKLEGRDFHFVVVQPGDSPYAERYRKMGADVEFVSMSVIRRSLAPGYIWGYFVNFIPTVFRLIKLCKRRRIDLVHTNTTQILGAGLAARLLGLPSVYHAHSYSMSRPEWVARALTWWFRATGDRILANSPLTASIFTDRGYPAEKIKVIWNPVDVEEFELKNAANEFRKEIGADEDCPLIGAVGRVARIKCLEHFIDAALILSKRFPKAKFVIVGGAHTDDDKRYLEELKDRVRSLGLTDKMFFTGRRVDIPNVMKSLDALAHTCVYEGFGLVVAEAMAAKKPVVAAATGAMPYVVEDGETGYLTPFGDAQKMADSLADLINDPDLAARMGEKGAEKVNRLWRSDVVANSVAQTYHDLLDRNT